MSLKLEPLLHPQERGSVKEETDSDVVANESSVIHPDSANPALEQLSEDRGGNRSSLSLNLDPVFFFVAAISTVGIVASLLTLYLRSESVIQQNLRELKDQTAELEARISAGQILVTQNSASDILPTEDVLREELQINVAPSNSAVTGMRSGEIDQAIVEKTHSASGSVKSSTIEGMAVGDVSGTASNSEPTRLSAQSPAVDVNVVDGSIDLEKNADVTELQVEIEKLNRLIATQREQIEFLAQENHELRIAAEFTPGATDAKSVYRISQDEIDQSPTISDAVERELISNEAEVVLLPEVPQSVDRNLIDVDLLVMGVENSGLRVASSDNATGGVSGGELTELIVNGYNAYIEGDYRSAEKWYDKAMHLDPYSRDANLGVAAIASLQGHNRLAENRYRHLLSLNPDDKTAFSALLLLASADNSIEHELLALIEQQARDRAGLYAVLGHFYSQQRRWSESSDAYRKSLAFNSAGMINADDLFNLAVSLDNLGQTGPAATYYQQALNTDGMHSFDDVVARDRLRLIVNRP